MALAGLPEAVGEEMIDHSRLDELRREIADDGFSEVFALFLGEADAVVARLSRVCSSDELAAHLHSLKGSALNLGLRDLAARCQEGERRLSDGTFAEGDVPDLITAYKAAKVALIAALAENGPA